MSAAAVILLGMVMSAQWEYPFDPFPDADAAKQAARLERSFAAKNGVGRAVRRLCAGDTMSLGVADLVARNFLIAHADRTFPRLLGMLAAQASKRELRECAPQMEWTVLAGLCSGYDIGGSGPELDARPLAVERRERVRRTLIQALEEGGQRGKAAMEILQRAGTELCDGAPEAVRAATAVLVQWLDAPRRPPSRRADDDGQEPPWKQALRALTFKGVDRAIAETPVRAFLASDETVALAALSLARMGADATPALPQLQGLLDAAVGPPGAWPPGQLTRLGDVLRALQAIGKPAAPALPNVAAFAQRIELPECRTFGTRAFADLVRAVATPAASPAAVAILRPMLRCPGTNVVVTKALAELGPAARDALLSALRDENRTIAERVAAADALARPGQAPLDGRDRRLVGLLQAKLQAHQQHGTWKVSPPPLRTAAEEVSICRAEAGLPPLPVSKPHDVSRSFASCISNYLCGPERERYLQTMARCCGQDATRSGGACRELHDSAGGPDGSAP